MKKIFFILSIVLIIIAIPATIFLTRNQQELRKKAVPATTLALSPATVTKKVGDTFSLDITIDTGTNQVVAADIRVTYDPEKLEAQSITNSTVFPNILTSGIVSRGSASIAVGASDVRKPYRGIGTIAVVRFKTIQKTETPATVRLAQDTFVGGLGENATNVLIGSTPTTITVTDDGTTTSADAPQSVTSPSPSPTSSPTQTNTLLNTATAAATLTISTPATSSAATTATPTIRGKAAAGATVTITIYSTPKTVVVTADANGNWSYTPTVPLETGSHSVVASATDATGKTQTATTTFIVAAGGGSVATQSATIIPTPQPIPLSGNASLTILLVSVGMLLLLGGVAFATAAHP